VASDWVVLFNLELAERLLSMDRATLTSWVDDNGEGIREQARRRQEQHVRINLGGDAKLAAAALADSNEEWNLLRSYLDSEPFEEARAAIAEAAAKLEDPRRRPH
jgi:hypothetical protein